MDPQGVPPRSRAGTSEPPLLLAFADGALNYACAECTALCCRGHGFGGSLRQEMQTLITLHPSLAHAAAERHGDVVFFRNPARGCYFLDADDRCGIETRHGAALKPGICRLFPFNVFSRIGPVLAVSPHFLCPLRLVVPPRPGQVAGTHRAVEASLRESGLLDPGFLDSRPLAALPPTEDAWAVVERERAFRDLCAEGLGQRRFSDTLRAASADADALAGRVSRARRVLGVGSADARGARDRLDELLLALAPSLRLTLLSLPAEAILAALWLAETISRQISSLEGEPTLQSVHGAVAPAIPALMLLARGDEPLPGIRGEVRVASLASPELTFAAYLVLREARRPAGTLAALETAIPSSMSVADRSVLLTYLGNAAAASRGRARHRHPTRVAPPGHRSDAPAAVSTRPQPGRTTRR